MEITNNGNKIYIVFYSSVIFTKMLKHIIITIIQLIIGMINDCFIVCFIGKIT